MRAHIANRDVGQPRAALPSTEMVTTQQLQLQPLMTQPHQQQLQQHHHLHLSLPSTAGMLPHSKDDHEGVGGARGGGGGEGGGEDNDEDEDDDDDELLDAVALLVGHLMDTLEAFDGVELCGCLSSVKRYP
ncbi:hypothetical protein ECG_09286 [Echinococcus granulosus]|nr:hypothetical protein ECG_09286 [Echinococcus granulosus]